MNAKKIITETLVAWILIQASWFMMWALIDISTVATTAISAFPMSFIQNDAGLKTSMKNSIDKFKDRKTVVELDKELKIKKIPITNVQSSEDIRQSILPNNNSVSWPFLFLGMAIFHFQDYLGASSDPHALTIGFLLRFFWIFLFSIWLFLLFIANLMRIGLLRLFIIGSPFFILMQVFKFWEWDKGIWGIFKLPTLLAIVFKPVIFVIGISLMLIVLVSMQKGMFWSATREANLNGATLSITWTDNATSVLAIEWITHIEANQKNLFWTDFPEAGKNVFSETIILLLSLFLMRWFIKLSLTIGWWPIEKVMETWVKHAEDIAKATPIIPWGASIGGIWSIMEKNRDKAFGWFGLNTSWDFGEMDKYGSFTKNEDKFSHRVDKEILWKKLWWWTDTDRTVLSNLASGDKYDKFFDTSKQLAQQREWWLSLVKNPEWEKNLKVLLSDKNKVSKLNQQLWTDFTPWEEKQEAEIYFSRATNTQSLYKAMGWNDATRKKLNPQSHNDIKNIVFYPTE